jgi:hypothetical protein
LDVNVALLPAAELAASIVALSHRLAVEFASMLILHSERGPLPHLTLYLTGYEERHVPMIARRHARPWTTFIPDPESEDRRSTQWN